MDIAVPSNLERLLFEACDRDGARLASLYSDLSRNARVPLPAPVHAALQASGIATASVDDTQTRDALLALNARTGILVCPHAAVGFAAAQRHPPAKNTTDVILATAHPAKFPETLKAVTGQDISLPARCGSLQARSEMFETMAPDLERIRDHILTIACA
jgi:threonine synthase